VPGVRPERAGRGFPCFRRVSPGLSLHKSVVGCGAAKGNSAAFIVSAHAGEIGASGDSPFEMVDVRRLQLWASRLIMM
jgi:hypothetical protein